ncbi:unnamed protein product [Phytomonas sp. Hart1]|nr:unnamed protein product [Phytomonas sp. Hart1]|eukprot:CCW72130.1 unnamed protein product [Phytomonas sp. isolate Hart1]
MEVYRRIIERVRGALWAHHRRLMPERQFHRILAYVYNNKYEHQIRFDRMEVVGTEWGGRVEVVTTPGGHMKRVRVHPCLEELTEYRRKQVIFSAYANACQQGHELMKQAELNIYKQFLNDIKPIVLGIRDNPEFYTVSENSIESLDATLNVHGPQPELTFRTIPAAKAYQPTDEVRRRHEWLNQWFRSPQGRRWSHTLRGKEYFTKYGPQYRPPGAPGAKKQVLPFELNAAYTPMDEGRLHKKNWMAYLDNKHVAESLWTRAKVADREKKMRKLQETGQAWHRPINEDAVNRW